jgi:hypothetical protein
MWVTVGFIRCNLISVRAVVQHQNLNYMTFHKIELIKFQFFKICFRLVYFVNTCTYMYVVSCNADRFNNILVSNLTCKPRHCSFIAVRKRDHFFVIKVNICTFLLCANWILYRPLLQNQYRTNTRLNTTRYFEGMSR